MQTIAQIVTSKNHHVVGLSRYPSAPPPANMRFTNGIHILDIQFKVTQAINILLTKGKGE